MSTKSFVSFALACAAAFVLSAPAGVLAGCGDSILETAEQCDDGNLLEGDCCSSDCLFEPNGQVCDDGDPCSSDGTCSDGSCNATGNTCDDGDDCTSDLCSAALGGCVYELIEGCCNDSTDCDDGIVCNGIEECEVFGAGPTGSCVPGPDISCDDGDSCTLDECDPSRGGCHSTPDSSLTDCVVADVDLDGVWDRLDSCIDTSDGLIPVFEGCSVSDLARHSDVLIRGSDEELKQVAERFFSAAEFRREQKTIQKILKILDSAAHELSRGRSCKSAKRFLQAEKQSDKLLAGINRRRIAARAIAANRSSAEGDYTRVLDYGADHRSVDLAYEVLEIAIKSVQDASARFIEASGVLELICSSSDRYRGRVTLAEFNSGNGAVWLEDGTLVEFSHAKTRGLALPGSAVSIKGERYSSQQRAPGDEVVASTIVSKGNYSELLSFDVTSCIEVRVAAVQPKQPFYGAENLATDPALFSLDGYRFEGAGSSSTHYLEHGMALYVESKDCPSQQVDNAGHFMRYSVDFKAKVKGNGNKKKPKHFARMDVGADEYWMLPQSLANYNGKLEMTWYRRQCDINQLDPCNSSTSYATAVVLRKDSVPIWVVDQGGYCSVEYEETEFALEDLPRLYDSGSSLYPKATYDTFRPAKIIGFDPFSWNTILGGTAVLYGWAYEITGATTSTYPSLDLIGLTTPFAIYATRDPYWNESGYVGVDSPAGVAWPGAVGVRNNAFYRYACKVPLVVRDAVDFCSPTPESYYRLPYTGSVAVGQGNNNPNFTHTGSQTYAFDFGLAKNKAVVAARGGKVIFTQENASASCYDSTKTMCTEEQNYCCVQSAGGGMCTMGDPAKIGDPCNANSECDSLTPGGDGSCSCSANSVWIQHVDGSVAAYLHLVKSGVAVFKDQRVFRGDKIGSAGNTGCSTEAHLHFHVVGAGDTNTEELRFETSGADCVIPATNSNNESTNISWTTLP
jgi:cysteine-rich repeat protein